MSPVEFKLTLADFPDTPKHVLIEACVDEENYCGFIATESVNDIFALRDAIEEFIDQHNLSRNDKN